MGEVTEAEIEKKKKEIEGFFTISDDVSADPLAQKPFRRIFIRNRYLGRIVHPQQPVNTPVSNPCPMESIRQLRQKSQIGFV